MTNIKRLWRRRKKLILAFIAAAGSFLVGVTLPVNVRTDRAQTPPQVKVVTVSQSQTQNQSPKVNRVKRAIEQRVEFSKQELDRLQENRFNSSLPSQFRGTTLRQATLNSQQKAIALTFDDGPWPKTTEQILDILKKNNIKATFFWVGRYLQSYPELGRKVAAAGHAIGNHTWSHQYHQHNDRGASREIDRTTSLIQEVTGVKTSMFRPPGGILTNGLVAYAQKKDYATIMWSADSLDWRSSTQSLMENVMRQANSGGIVLMHDGGGNRARTVQALPEIISRLRKEGYRFVTVPELLQMQEKQLKQQETAQR
ncbi:MAG: polysaccharide deacetylase family protein [Microcoleus sp.]